MQRELRLQAGLRGAMGAAGLQSLSSSGFPTPFFSEEPGVRAPTAPSADLQPRLPPTQPVCQAHTLHLPQPSSAPPGSGQLVCGRLSWEGKGDRGALVC